MAISFNEVPADVLVPGVYTEIDNSQATSGGTGVEERILLIGVINTTGTTGPADTIVQMFSASDGQQWGVGGMLDLMVQRAKQNNPLTRMDAIALTEDGSGVAAIYDLTTVGTATADGTIVLYPNGVRVPVAILSGDDPTAITTKIETALDAVADSLPFTTGTQAVGVLPLNMKWKGASGNGMECPNSLLAGEALPPGVTSVTLTVDTAGATDPDVATAITAMAGTRYTKIAMAMTETANLNALETELETRFGPTDDLAGVAFASIKDTSANLITLIGGATRNSQVMVIEGHDGSPQLPLEWCAALTAKVATEADPARPFHTLELEGLFAPVQGDRFTWSTRDQLLRNGVATVKISSDDRVLIERLVTTYQQNSQGAADTSYRNLNTVLSAIYFRDAVNLMARLKFPRHKLADDGTRFGPGQAVVTPAVFKTEIVALAKDLEVAAIQEDIAGFIETLIVERNANDPDRLDWQAFPNFVNQARVFAGKVSFKV